MLTVGYLPFPQNDARRGADFVPSQEPPDLASLPEEVSLSLEEGLEIRSGSHVRSTLTIRNESTFDLVVGKLVPPVVDPTSEVVIGGYEGAITMELRRYHVPAGDSKELAILIGTASTRPDVGWAVPPGRWAVRMLVRFGGEGAQRMVPIEVVP